MRSEQLLWRYWLLLSFCRISTRTTRLVHHRPSNMCICYKTLIWPFAPLNRVYVVVAFSDSEIHLHLCTKYLKERELNLSVHITKIGFKLILFGVWRTQDSNYLLARTTAHSHIHCTIMATSAFYSWNMFIVQWVMLSVGWFGRFGQMHCNFIFNRRRGMFSRWLKFYFLNIWLAPRSRFLLKRHEFFNTIAFVTSLPIIID